MAYPGPTPTTEDELRSAFEYFSGIFEHSADIIITVNPDGIIETFNRGAEDTLGYTRADVIGRPMNELFADPAERDAALIQLRETDNVRNYETRFRAADGAVRNVLLTLSRLRDADGKPIGTFGISKDITREKQLLRELVQSRKFAAIGQAVTGIQHAIKNMLNALTGGSYLVRIGMKTDDKPQIEEGWSMVEEGIGRITDLSRNMLNYAKEWKPQLEQIDLHDLVKSACELHRPTADEKGIEITITPEAQIPGAGAMVKADPKLLHMAITDIMVNAIDACAMKTYAEDTQPAISVRASQADHACIEIADNGCGMTDETRTNIFTPFFSTKETLGTGLGLALTARIIHAHGGKITVESEPDRGTRFRIHLPGEAPTV